MVRAAFGSWRSVVYREVAEREHDAATDTHALLTSIQRMLVRAVIGQAHNVRALGDVSTPHGLEQQRPFALHAAFYQIGGERRQVNACPLPAKPVRCHACRGATAEGVQHHVSLVAARLDDAASKAKGFWVG